jgi:hypothetical protein
LRLRWVYLDGLLVIVSGLPALQPALTHIALSMQPATNDESYEAIHKEPSRAHVTVRPCWHVYH